MDNNNNSNVDESVTDNLDDPILDTAQAVRLTKKEVKELGKRNADINKMLQKEKKRLDAEVKLLLLGTGASGKSTIAKQMKILHLGGFSASERADYTQLVCNNIMTSIRTLIDASIKLNIPLGDNNREAVGRVLNANKDALTPQNFADVKALWKDKGIQKTLENSSKFQLDDSTAYFLNDLDRVSTSGYVPSETDILHARAKTTGINEIPFSIDKMNFRLVDVGGQRSERRKWLHCFEGVTAILFCVALSEYDLALEEDEGVNRMHESVELFGKISQNGYFKDTSIILFLNKKDLFMEKIKKKSRPESMLS